MAGRKPKAPAQLTVAQLKNVIEEPQQFELLKMWLDRGDGVAVYVNEDRGHRDLGLKKFVSCTATGDPPQILPDVGGESYGGTNSSAFADPHDRGDSEPICWHAVGCLLV
jgi:hypothetical protein